MCGEIDEQCFKSLCITMCLQKTWDCEIKISGGPSGLEAQVADPRTQYVPIFIKCNCRAIFLFFLFFSSLYISLTSIVKFDSLYLMIPFNRGSFYSHTEWHYAVNSKPMDVPNT